MLPLRHAATAAAVTDDFHFAFILMPRKKRERVTRKCLRNGAALRRRGKAWRPKARTCAIRALRCCCYAMLCQRGALLLLLMLLPLSAYVSRRYVISLAAAATPLTLRFDDYFSAAIF